MINRQSGWYPKSRLSNALFQNIPRVLPLRTKEGRYVYEQVLPPRLAYILSGPARYKWQHSLPPMPALRNSLTFRTLKKSSLAIIKD